MATNNDPHTLHTAEGIRHLQALPAQADAGRVEDLESLGRLRTAKAAMLAREHTRLTQKYGGDHPRVQALAQQITANRLLVNHVSAEAGRARVAEVDADPKAWILHGRIMDQELQGEPGLTVALYDSRGTRVQGLGSASTNPTGYFKLSTTTVATAGGPATAQPSTGGPATQPPTAAGAAAPRPTAAARGPVYVHVLDSRSATLWSDPRALQPALGRVDYEEVVLRDTNRRDPAPPDGKKPEGPTDAPPSPTASPRAAKNRRAKRGR